MEYKTITEQYFKGDKDFWQDTQTKTSNRESCKSSFKEFRKNYERIYEFNKPVMKYFDKSYKKDFINNDHEDHGDYIYCKPMKRTDHFRIYPLFPYLTAMKKTEPQPHKKNSPDYSIFLRILKQLVMILNYNVTKKKNNPKNYRHNIQIYPILPDNDCPEFEELYYLMVDKMNLVVVELLEDPEVFCCVIPKDAINDNQMIFGPTGQFQSFNQMTEEFKQMENQNPDVIASTDFFKEKVPIEIKELLIDLIHSSKIKKNWEEMIMNCLFMEETFELKEKGIKWKVDQEFLLEYYLLVQINRMCAVIAKEANIDLPEGSCFEEIVKNYKNLKSLLPEVNKEKVPEFFAKNNMTYLCLLKCISEKDFMKDLLLFKPNIIKNINPKNLHDELTPLKLFYLFLNDMQVFY